MSRAETKQIIVTIRNPIPSNLSCQKCNFQVMATTNLKLTQLTYLYFNIETYPHWITLWVLDSPSWGTNILPVVQDTDMVSPINL